MAVSCGYCNDKGCVVCKARKPEKPLYVQHSFKALDNKNVPIVAFKVQQAR